MENKKTDVQKYWKHKAIITGCFTALFFYASYIPEYFSCPAFAPNCSKPLVMCFTVFAGLFIFSLYKCHRFQQP